MTLERKGFFPFLSFFLLFSFPSFPHYFALLPPFLYLLEINDMLLLYLWSSLDTPVSSDMSKVWEKNKRQCFIFLL